MMDRMTIGQRLNLSLMKSLCLCRGFPGGNNEETELYTASWCSWWPEGVKSNALSLVYLENSQSHVRRRKGKRVGPRSGLITATSINDPCVPQAYLTYIRSKIIQISITGLTTCTH
ncbi:hypothetical protein XELAEV_18001110mg [Xenopus laevis]|uniref:Uncharacterized protein n=1 Tax=Xenopus laevis TaxID=8355 RepID=A0A974BQD8_XENLA|nr:hypothetical protein XELAEV_18001110mg [Xenopus laevis]